MLSLSSYFEINQQIRVFYLRYFLGKLEKRILRELYATLVVCARIRFTRRFSVFIALFICVTKKRVDYFSSIQSPRQSLTIYCCVVSFCGKEKLPDAVYAQYAVSIWSMRRNLQYFSALSEFSRLSTNNRVISLYI